MDTISPSTVSLVELLVALIGAVGVGNFILIMFVVMLFVNLPTIITSIRQIFTSNSKSETLKENHRLIGETQRTISELVADIGALQEDHTSLNGEIKTLVAITDSLHSSIVKESDERRQENAIISETLERQVRAIEAIDRIMRNVMSEDDTIRAISFIIGIKSSFKHDIMSKVTAIIDGNQVSSDGPGLIDLNLRTDIETTWSDIKTEIDRFKTPVKIRIFLDEYERNLWSNTGLFTKIIHIASTSTLEPANKKSVISKQLDNGLRALQSELHKYLQKVKSVTRGE